ncbi:hypothetical protein [Prauserella alba]|uniref:DUF3311 domain-containing protein n=1 Tax=Prauserella alba TaxID=176898 RepID=A0ABP4G572_9PSEU|nr:hypothetical protein [Prauserella alba]MCP2182926.1 hypothetical protein [Prauserella alba]
MSESAPSRRREPIRNPWIWIGLVVIVLVGIPWYLPPGTLYPLLFGLPVWTLVAVASSVGVCGFLHWALSKHWNLVEDVEEAAASGASKDGSESWTT